MPKSAEDRIKDVKSGQASSNQFAPEGTASYANSSITPISGDFDQDKQNEHDSRQQAKDRAQSFAMNSMNRTGGFSSGQDYTGGASSIGMSSFNPGGKKGIGSSINEKYSFKAPS